MTDRFPEPDLDPAWGRDSEEPGPTGTAGEPSALRGEIVAMLASELQASKGLNLSREEADTRAEQVMVTYDRLRAAAARAAPASPVVVWGDKGEASGGFPPASPAVREAAEWKSALYRDYEAVHDRLAGEPIEVLRALARLYSAALPAGGER